MRIIRSTRPLLLCRLFSEPYVSSRDAKIKKCHRVVDARKERESETNVM